MKTFIFAAYALVASTSVQASLQSVDWQTTNDGLLTHDTQSGLYWLDLPTTERISVTRGGYTQDQIRIRLNTDLVGFRYASVDEVNALFTHAGITLNNDGVYHPLDQSISDLIDLLGPTSVSGDTKRALGVTDSVCHSCQSDTRYWVPSLSVDGSRSNASLNQLQIRRDSVATIGGSATTEYGHFLVRQNVSQVPIPHSLWLFGSALLGCISLNRKLQSS